MPRNKGRLSADEFQYVRQVLESLLAEEVDPPPTLDEVALWLGCKVETLHRNFPDLCRAIISRVRRKYIDAEALYLMRSTLEKALASDERLPLDAVAQQLGYSSSTLRKYFPEHCQAIVKR